MEKIGNDLNIVICYEDFIYLNSIVENNFIILEKLKKNMILEKNVEQIKVLNEIAFVHKTILNTIVTILEKGKRCMNNYIKEIQMLESLLLQQYCDVMLKTTNQFLRDEYLNMFDEIDDVLLKLNQLVDKSNDSRNVENEVLDDLQFTIEERLSKIKC